MSAHHFAFTGTRGQRGVLLALTAALAMAALAASSATTARAAIVFDPGPGKTAPGPTLGTYTMSRFPLDGQTLLSDVPGVAAPGGGDVMFGALHNHRRVAAGGDWATWTHNYMGDVYYTKGATSSTMNMPPNTKAFYFYAEPDPFGLHDITATAQPGTVTSTTISVNGAWGATYFGFYDDDPSGAGTISSITVSSDDGFAVGEFGIK